MKQESLQSLKSAKVELEESKRILNWIIEVVKDELTEVKDRLDEVDNYIDTIFYEES